LHLSERRLACTLPAVLAKRGTFETGEIPLWYYAVPTYWWTAATCIGNGAWNSKATKSRPAADSYLGKLTGPALL